VPVTIDSLPIYVRAGAFVFRQPVVQHTGQMVGQPLFVHVYPAAASEASFYEDDGETMAYRHGESARRRFAQRRDARSVTVDAGAVEGAYRPAARDLVFTVVGEEAASRVLVDGQPVARVEPPALAASSSGWTVRDGSVILKVRDRPEALRLTIER
jgi:alpha-glucosidase (family GH31 glycosyl hydrolase)